MSVPKVRLNTAERESYAWKKVEAVLQQRLADNTATCTNPARDERDRFMAAVKVAELKELLKLAEPAQEKLAGAGE
jgi:hypothetical protein